MIFNHDKTNDMLFRLDVIKHTLDTVVSLILSILRRLQATSASPT